MDTPLVKLVGGAIALLGLLFTIFSYFAGRRAEALSINRAVLAEVSRLLEVIENHYKWWNERVDAADTYLPLYPLTTDVYTALTAQLGRMDAKIVGIVARFYGFVAFVNAMQAGQAQHRALGRASEFDEQYEIVLFNLLGQFGHAFDRAFEQRKIPPPRLNASRKTPHRLLGQAAAGVHLPPGAPIVGA